MHEIIPNLWLGDIRSVENVDQLREKNIRCVVTAMRGKLAIEETFYQHRIEIDDAEDEDMLPHLVPAITFIQKQLDNGYGVLVHCLAGISRSATIVAAYLMYSRGIDADDALALIRQARSQVEPNKSFMSQLNVFYKASCRVSNHDKTIRMYYLERAVKNIQNGGVVNTEVLAEMNTHTTDSQTASSPASKRRIRCKKCRQELATREHMIGHGQTQTPAPPPIQPRIHSSVQRPPVIPPSKSTAPNDARVAASMTAADEKKAEAETLSPPVLQPSSSTVPTSDVPKSIPLPASYMNRSAPLPRIQASISSPILSNPKCSGYFVEPASEIFIPIRMKWMEPFLSQGQLAGKVVCPNPKCGAKLGNYDWAGVCCSCKEWVVPGFCIHRSKVDEIG
ncbi:phosphatases II [Panus rudis PR-1116 ss-1]|nr:phosphatases II [Panus rudis PR-1116 ss-1]